MLYCVHVFYLAFSIKYQFLCGRCFLYRVYTRQTARCCLSGVKYGRIFIPNIMPQLLHCVWAIPVYTFFQVSPLEELRDCQGMWSPIHENALRCWSARYVLHRPIVTEQVLKWHDIIYSSVCILPPTATHRAKVRSVMCQSSLRHPV